LTASSSGSLWSNPGIESRFIVDNYTENLVVESPALQARPTAGGPEREVVLRPHQWFALYGTRVLVVDNFVSYPGSASKEDGTADLELVDLATGAAPMRLATRVDANIVLASDKHSVVVSSDRYSSQENGVYVLYLP